MAIDFIVGDKIVVNNAYVVVTLATSNSKRIRAAVSTLGLLGTAVGTVAAVGNFALPSQTLSYIRVVPDNTGVQAYNDGRGIVIYFESDDQLNNSFELSTAFFPDVNTQRVYNDSGSTLAKGSLVYNTGFNTTVQLATVDLASAASMSTAFLIGILLEDIDDGESGACLTQGAYQGLDTSGGTINQLLFLSDTPGQFSLVTGTVTAIIGRIQVVNTEGTIFIAGEFPLGQGTGSGTQGVTGLSGPTGIQGNTGVQGLGVTGLAGGTGLFGSTGIQGNTGAQGLGVTGLVGETGLLGPTGIQGNTGAQGLGVTGLIGSTGISGIDGVTGFQGTTGIAGMGMTGLIGTTGLLGPTGIQGTTGTAGLGTTGLIGTTGLLGPTGIQGVTGIAGTGVTGLSGVTGVQGTTGVQGLGVTGLQGLTGVLGIDGVTGLQGVTGIAGNGVTGLQGVTGIEGSGVTGLQGVTGIAGTGVTGLQGVTGIQGLTGLQGITGIGVAVSLERLRTTTVNMITGGATEVVIYDQAIGPAVVIDSVVVRLTAASAITVVPLVGVGFNAGGADNVFVPVSLTGVTAVNDIWTFSATAKAVYNPGTGAATLLLGIDTGATGTTMLTSVDVIGYRF